MRNSLAKENLHFIDILGVIITTTGFIVTWTPYAIAFFISAFRGKDYGISPLVTFFCACFAKSSVLWIPILYMSTSTQFQFNFINRNIFENQQIDTNNKMSKPDQF